MLIAHGVDFDQTVACEMDVLTRDFEPDCLVPQAAFYPYKREMTEEGDKNYVDFDVTPNQSKIDIW